MKCSDIQLETREWFFSGKGDKERKMISKLIQRCVQDKVLSPEIGFEYIATGHYARVEGEMKGKTIKKGRDPIKDQSYMLWNISRELIERTLFPIGDLNKEYVRKNW